MKSRNGFTLIELLVVIGIITLLASIVVWSVAGTRGVDRASAASRNVQAQILGGRDRAVHARAPRGVRLARDPGNPQLVTAISPIQPLPPLRYGGPAAPIQLERLDLSPADGHADRPEVLIVRGLDANSDWLSLRQRGHLSVPFRMRIPADVGTWFTVEQLSVDGVHPNETIARLAADFGDSDPGCEFDNVVAVPASSTRANCELELGFGEAPHSTSESLPSGVVIDLAYSRIPDAWRNPAVALDVIYTPSGALSGVLKGTGPVYLVLRDVRDADLGLDPANSACVGPAVGIAISPQTGLVESFPIDPTDLVDNTTQAVGPDGRADDLFHFAHARTGGHP